MSKEQTPITVEEKSLAYYAKNCADELIKTPISVLRYISELEQKVADNEQYAQAKVLEALEEYEDNILQILDKKADVKDYILRNRMRIIFYKYLTKKQM